MSILKIAGRVLWNDMQTPAGPNARVRIYDLDSGGNGNDLIFERVTDANGRFRGESREWQDANSVRTPLGELPVPDVLSLEFRVRLANGRTHRGPYFHLGDHSSVPIVLPFPRPDQPPTTPPVQPAQRELIHLITVSEQMPESDRLLYQVIEFGAAAVTSTLAPHYRDGRVRILQGADGTLARLRQELQSAASIGGVRAVDLIISTHGFTDKVYFYPNEESTMDEVATALRSLPGHDRSKFRAVFSTACFGASHADEWLESGFEVASGSREIYADGAVSYPAFAGMWMAGATFQKAINTANAADPLRVFDGIARTTYETQGRSGLAQQIDSFRQIKGDSRLTIAAVP